MPRCRRALSKRRCRRFEPGSARCGLAAACITFTPCPSPRYPNVPRPAQTPHDVRRSQHARWVRYRRWKKSLESRLSTPPATASNHRFAVEGSSRRPWVLKHWGPTSMHLSRLSVSARSSSAGRLLVSTEQQSRHRVARKAQVREPGVFALEHGLLQMIFGGQFASRSTCASKVSITRQGFRTLKAGVHGRDPLCLTVCKAP